MQKNETTRDAASSRLTAWKVRKIETGVPSEQLPSDEDLKIVARARPSSAHTLVNGTPLRDRERVARWATEITAEISGEPYLTADGTTARSGAGDGAPREPNAPPLEGVRLIGRKAAELWTPDPDSDPGVRGVEPGAEPQSSGPRFVLYDPGLRDASAQPRVGAVRAMAAADGSLRYRWPAAATEGQVLYRVVSRDDYSPLSPDDAHQVAVTTEPLAVDPRPMRRAVRYVQVWRHTGRDEAAACQAQPVLVARGLVVAPVQNAVVLADRGLVTGRWDAARGVHRVEVQRIPARDAMTIDFEPDYAVGADADLRSGFVDEGGEPGEVYVYRIYAVLEEKGVTTYSPMVEATVKVSAPLLPVTDLQAVLVAGRDDMVRLRCTVPRIGDVDVYRTPHPVPVEEEEMEQERLQSAGLTPQTRVEQPWTEDGESAVMARVPLLADSTRVHFTPVTVAGGKARMGTPVTFTSTGTVSDVKLVQRVDWQLLTFDWPPGAAKVYVYVTPKGTLLPNPPGPPDAQLDRAEYVARGGLRLRKVLPPSGCDVHVRPVAWSAGHEVIGRGGIVRYGGLIRIQYRLTGDQTGLAGSFRRALRSRALEVLSDSNVDFPVPFVLVHNEKWLPLSVSDGDSLLRIKTPLVGRQWMLLRQFDLDRQRRGYLRLFADLPDFEADIAVLDPPAESLQW